MIKSLTAILALLLLTGCAVLPGIDRGISMGTAIDDSALELSVRAALINSDARFADADLIIVVHNKRVLLVGQVASGVMVQSANDVIQQHEDVRLLHNQLREGTNRTTEMTLTDQWISVRTRNQLSWSRRVPAQRVVVVTFHGITYLLGRLSDEQAALAEQQAASVSGVQRVVSMFDLVDTPKRMP